MRIVIHDRKTDVLTVYKAGVFTVSDDYIILANENWRGFFPVNRFEFLGLDEDCLLG